MSFRTPGGYYDGYYDTTRPDGTQRPMIVNGALLTCTWSSLGQCWSPPPIILYHSATPMTSPVASPSVSTTIPFPSSGIRQYLSTTSTSVPSPPITFPPPVTLAPAPPPYTAHMLLESPLPRLSLSPFGIATQSSASNELYGVINNLVHWPLPHNL